MGSVTLSFSRGAAGGGDATVTNGNKIEYENITTGHNTYTFPACIVTKVTVNSWGISNTYDDSAYVPVKVYLELDGSGSFKAYDGSPLLPKYGSYDKATYSTTSFSNANGLSEQTVHDMWFTTTQGNYIFTQQDGECSITIEYKDPPSLTINTFEVSQNNNGTAKFKVRATGQNGSGSITYNIKNGSTTIVSDFTGSSGSTIEKTVDIGSTLSYNKTYTFTLTATYNSSVTATATYAITFVPPTISNPVLSLTENTLSWTAATVGPYVTAIVVYHLYKDGTEFDTTTNTQYAFNYNNTIGWDDSQHTITVQAVATNISNTAYEGLTSAMSNGVSYILSASSCMPPQVLYVSTSLTTAPVDLHWSGEIAGILNPITGYNIQYCDSVDSISWENWSESVFVESSPYTVYAPDESGSYRKFRIQVCCSAGEQYYSDWFESEAAIVRKNLNDDFEFIDPILTPNIHKIKAIHMTQMQDRINDLLWIDGKDRSSFTRIVAGETKLTGWTSHITEIRTAIDRYRPEHETWLELSIVENKPRADVVMQMRDVILGNSKIVIYVDGDNGLPDGCIVYVKNADDESIISEFEYNGPKTVTIKQNVRYYVECSALPEYDMIPKTQVQTNQPCSVSVIELMYKTGFRYGFRRAKATADPSARITYVYNAEGMTPMTVDMTTGEPNYGDWEAFVNEICRPVMLKTDGTVDYELDHSDQTKKLDGTDSDVANSSYDGNAMVEFRKYIWVSRKETDDYEEVVFSNIQYDETYNAYAHTNANNEYNDAFYWGMFKGTYSKGRLRSIGDGALMVSQTRQSEINRAQLNGTGSDMTSNGYYISYKSGWDYIADLLTLLGKSDDSQSVFGRGYVKSTNKSALAAGTLKAKPAFCGYSNGTTDVKALYIEGLWGNIWDQLAGIRYDPTVGFKIKMYPPYSLDAEGYLDTGINPAYGSGWFVQKSSCTGEFGYIPKTMQTSETTYMCDRCTCSESTNTPIIIGGGYSNENECGSRCMYADVPANQSQTWIGARLTYVSPNANANSVYGLRYGFKREKANSDPDARITYLYDAINMTPTSKPTDTTFDMGDWEKFIDELCRPVMLKMDGTVDYELDHSDQTKKLDGTTSDICTSAYDGNGMAEFRKYKWVHRSEDDKYEYVIFSDVQWDDTYHAYAHTNEDGEIADAFYYGLYRAVVVSGKLRSVGGQGSIKTGLTMAQEMNYAAANGTGYCIASKSQRDYLCDILTLICKSDNAQKNFGNGISGGSSATAVSTTRSS